MIRGAEEHYAMTPLSQLRLGLAWVGEERALQALRGSGPLPEPEEVEVQVRMPGVRP
jgi:hypothetical protein